MTTLIVAPGTRISSAPKPNESLKTPRGMLNLHMLYQGLSAPSTISFSLSATKLNQLSPWVSRHYVQYSQRSLRRPSKVSSCYIYSMIGAAVDRQCLRTLVTTVLRDCSLFISSRYLNDFSKALASEVRILLAEVGKLRDERRALQL